MKRLILSFAIIAASLGLAAGAEASTATTTLSVSATAITTCSVSTTPVDFGNITGLSAVTVNGEVTVNCTSGVPYNIALDAGLNYDGSNRHITNGLNNHPYALYRDIGYINEWGDTGYGNTYPASLVSDTGNGANQPHMVFGALFSGSTPLPAGGYYDIVTVTVYY